MENYNILRQIVINRRSTKPAALNGRKIEDQQIRHLLELANWAPTHGSTEPWRFVVYSGEAVRQFCHRHAEMYKETTPADRFSAAKYEKQQHNGDMASHLIAVYMHRGNNPNITALEEICATAAAVQNILLAAEALGIAVLWSTGGSVLQPALKDFLRLDEEDVVLGLLYMGYTDEPARPGRRMPIEEKTTWVNDMSH